MRGEPLAELLLLGDELVDVGENVAVLHGRPPVLFLSTSLRTVSDQEKAISSQVPAGAPMRPESGVPPAETEAPAFRTVC
ncbi:hypothetical protein GCM10017559_72320 [Streptosporangium longisporum]|uniref:Uncharacterized protein n=1 Tax=Streptosporangium longisporum TaxID=46187 RepID=A0ABP6L9Q9_9ACTN